MVSLLIVRLHLAGYEILYHTSNAILFTRNGERFEIRFTRHEQEGKNSPVNEFSIHIDRDSPEAERFLAVVRHLAKNHLLPLYYQEQWQLLYQANSYDLTITSEEIPFSQQCSSPLHLGKKATLIQKEETTAHDLRGLNAKIEESREKTLKRFDQYIEKIAKLQTAPVRLLHLSDLHIDPDFDIDAQVAWLRKDLESLQYLRNSRWIICLSGDIANRGSEEEYATARRFVEKLCEELDSDAQRLLIVAGNHDYSRPLAQSAYEVTTHQSDFRPSVDFRIDERYILRRNKDRWDRRFDPFGLAFYAPLFNRPYQYTTPRYLRYENIEFLMLNTAKEIDHFHPTAVTFTRKELRQFPIHATHKTRRILIGHHPLESGRDYEFIEALLDREVCAYLHGHVHKSNSLKLINDETGRSCAVVGAGLFAVDSKRRPGVPLLYHILTFHDEAIEITSRSRESGYQAWQPAYIYRTDPASQERDFSRNICTDPSQTAAKGATNHE